LSEEDVKARLKLCQDHCSYYRTHGRHFRRRYLKERADKAREEGNEEAEKEILGIIKRENERSFWRRVKYAMKKQSGGSVRVVQVEDGEGEIREFSTQAEVTRLFGVIFTGNDFI